MYDPFNLHQNDTLDATMHETLLTNIQIHISFMSLIHICFT